MSESRPRLLFSQTKGDYISKYINITAGQEILHSLVTFCKRHDVPTSDCSDPTIATAFRQLKEGMKGLPKESLAAIYRGFRANVDNIAVLAAYSEKYRAAWREILQSPVIEADKIKRIYGSKPEIIEVRRNSWESYPVMEAMFFPLQPEAKYQSFYGFRAPEIEDYTLSPYDRRFLAESILGPESVMPRFVEELPEDERLQEADFESDLASTELFNLQGMALEGNILKQSGQVMTAKLRKIVSSETIRPFELGNQALNRPEIVSIIYFTYYGVKGQTPDIKQLSRFAVEEFPRHIYGQQLASFLPHIKGITRSIAEQSYFHHLTELVSEIIKYADRKWLDMSNFRMLLLSTVISGFDTNRALRLFPKASLDYLIRESDHNRGYDYYNRPKEISMITEIGFPMAYNWVQTLCGLGILEALYDIDGETIRYVRLTQLGRFAFNLTAEYTAPVNEVASQIEFDADNSILTDLTPDSPYSFLLSKMATPIGGNRYRLSARTIACDCDSIADVDKRRETIMQITSRETFALIDPIFSEAEKRLSCGKIESGYDLITIRPELDELRQLLTTDPQLTKFVSQLGRNTFLIRTSDRTQLHTLLSTNGFKL